MQTLEVIGNFEGTLVKFSEVSEENKKQEILSKIEQINGLNPNVYERVRLKTYLKKRASILQTLADDYLTAEISSRFPLINDGLFALRRSLYIENTRNGYQILEDITALEDVPAISKKHESLNNVERIEVPLFAYTSLDDEREEHKTLLGKITIDRRKIRDMDYENTYEKNLWITANLPGENLDGMLRKARYEALGEYFSILGKAMKLPVVGDILSQEIDLMPDIGAIWIPTADSLDLRVTEHLVHREYIDPAMILSARDKKYLITTWNVKDEEPFEHYLREFTSE